MGSVDFVHPTAVPVLCYHSVVIDWVPGFWAVSRETFIEQMNYLAEEGYHPIPLADYAAWVRQPGSTRLPSKPCVITFDDGLADFANAVDVLVEHRFPSTMFVPTAYIGKTSSWLPGPQLGGRPVMSVSELVEIRDAGVEIGAHAHIHRPLDERSRQSVREDVTKSKQILEDKLGEEVLAFAYPHGYNDRRSREEVARAGFGYACGVKETLSGPSDDIFAISRVFAHTSSEMAAFAQLLENGARPMHDGERLVTKGWRAARRLRALAPVRSE